MMLERCDGPPCPRCGCRDCRILEAPPHAPALDPARKLAETYGTSQWFAAGRARCQHCGLRFSFRELPVPSAGDRVAGDTIPAGHSTEDSGHMAEVGSRQSAVGSRPADAVPSDAPTSDLRPPTSPADEPPLPALAFTAPALEPALPAPEPARRAKTKAAPKPRRTRAGKAGQRRESQ